MFNNAKGLLFHQMGPLVCQDTLDNLIIKLKEILCSSKQMGPPVCHWKRTYVVSVEIYGATTLPNNILWTHNKTLWYYSKTQKYLDSKVFIWPFFTFSQITYNKQLHSNDFNGCYWSICLDQYLNFMLFSRYFYTQYIVNTLEAILIILTLSLLDLSVLQLLVS